MRRGAFLCRAGQRLPGSTPDPCLAAYQPRTRPLKAAAAAMAWLAGLRLTVCASTPVLCTLPQVQALPGAAACPRGLSTPAAR
jgi:hypothetical protein